MNEYEGHGEGRSWPLLTGERGHYELAAGRDPLPFIAAMEDFANDGGMLPEQVWDADDLPAAKMKRGDPTGSAMPLCWAHSEYMTLVRSAHDGRCFDRRQVHTFTPFAKVRGTTITYPAEAAESAQKEPPSQTLPAENARERRRDAQKKAIERWENEGGRTAA